MEEKPLHVVIAGHSDHGKSTLAGRIFYDSGALHPEMFEEIKKLSKSRGREFEFSYIMDYLEEERSRGITVDVTHTFLKAGKRRYVIIDAPGHKEFFKNMACGISQGEAAFLVVDAGGGVQEQTLRHCYILALLGIRQIAVIVNKMDLVGYSEKAFYDVKKEIETALSRFELKPAHFIPVSAIKGENVAKRADRIPWHNGPTVFDALDSFKAFEIRGKYLRFPVQDIYVVDRKIIAVGRIEAGVLRKGQEIFVLPQKRKAKVVEIKKYMEDNIIEAGAGDCVGVRIEGNEPERGQILADRISSMITDTVRANIFWMSKDYQPGMTFTFRCATQEVRGRINSIYKRFDPASVEAIEYNADDIKLSEIAEVEIKLEAPVAIDKFSDIPQLGRFTLEHEGYPVAAGIIN